MFYFQTVRGLTPMQPALMLVPMVGMLLMAAGLFWYARLLPPSALSLLPA